MASSSLGWKELPYARTPLSLQPRSLVILKLEWKSVSFPDLNVALVSGIRSSNDVMRGEECELLGLIHLLPELADHTAATVIMPGTHSKHASLRNGMLTDFTTYMTGELFSHIQQMPTLATCFQENQDVFDEKTFRSGIEEFRRKGLPAALFTLRSRHVLNGMPFVTSFLGGLLISAELDQLSTRKDEKLFLCCSGEIQKNYMIAADCYKLSLQAIDAEMADVACLHGHASIRNHLSRTTKE
jgi:2-dehydro-3-deoxygalactonokinase